ncbi:uncharacterized protein [Diadema setosum]|uniref:uncharacterized protein n=1 Tax=Diadema setosum TaxID=31175 RepID=UPI003B3B2DED
MSTMNGTKPASISVPAEGLAPECPAEEQIPEMSPTSKEFKESLSQRRKSSQLLSPLRMKPAPRGVDAIDGADREEVEEEGVNLFNCFVEEELLRQGIQETTSVEHAVTSATIQSRQETPMVTVSEFKFTDHHTTSRSSVASNGSATPSLLKYQNPKWARKGRDLRKLADQFARSPERQRVREKASETIDDDNITAAMFWDMLSELFFQGQVTRERVVVLFFFCSDVAIFALGQKSVEYFHRFMVWALQFIRRHVCNWVADNGGWDTVLYASVSTLGYFAKGAAICLGAYLVYKLGKRAITGVTQR